MVHLNACGNKQPGTAFQPGIIRERSAVLKQDPEDLRKLSRYLSNFLESMDPIRAIRAFARAVEADSGPPGFIRGTSLAQRLRNQPAQSETERTTVSSRGHSVFDRQVCSGP